MASFSDEIAVFGASESEVDDAIAGVAGDIWKEVDSAMSSLWESELERSEAESLFVRDAILVEPVLVDGGVVRVRLDVEADTAAELTSRRLDHPVLGMRRYRGDWCTISLFERGRIRGELFWARRDWSENFDEDDVPRRAIFPARDARPFGIVLPRGTRTRRLRQILEADFPDALVFEAEFKKLCGMTPT